MRKNCTIKLTLYILFNLLNIETSFLHSENPCGIMMPRGGDEDWGIGGYLIPDEFSINVYDDSNGALYGRLFTQHSHIYLETTNKIKIDIEYSDIEYIGSYRNEIVKIKDCFNPNFAKVLWKTSKKILYIDKNEIENNGAKFNTYPDLLFDGSIKEKYKNYELNIGVNINKSCLNLRKEPNIKSSIVLCIKGNDWNKGYVSKIEIIKRKGDWAKVEYIEQHPPKLSTLSDDDCSFIEKNKKIGWLKAIGDNGFPNIWFSIGSH